MDEDEFYDELDAINKKTIRNCTISMGLSLVALVISLLTLLGK